MKAIIPMIIALVLAVIRANGWIVIPTYCVVLMWITAGVMFFYWCEAYIIADEVAKSFNYDLANALTDKCQDLGMTEDEILDYVNTLRKDEK